MKGILFAGGTGSRLFPITKTISKYLIPVYDKPMIYYPLSTLMLAGIKEILIITTEQDLPHYEALFADGKQLGILFEYAIQQEPKGLAEAFIIAESFIGNDTVALIQGDNLFYGPNLGSTLQEMAKLKKGCLILGCEVNNPRDYGIVELDANQTAVSIEEKPLFPKSSYVIPGLYFFDNEVVQIAKATQPSLGGELEVTSILDVYLKRKELEVILPGQGFTWFEMGTHHSLLKASNFVEATQERQGKYIACVEEIAFNLDYIDSAQLVQLAKQNKKSDYGNYLTDAVIRLSN